ncbi:MAG TPA: DoxX family protein, partial [Acidimicrobiia bacterium]
SLGFRPGRVMAAVAGLSEAGGGLLLALGLLTPLAGAALVGTLLVAASVHIEKGLWGTNGGYEMALVYGVVAATVALSGPGSVSLDRAFGIDDSWSVGLGLAAIAIGLLSGAAVIARAKWNLRHDAVATKSEAGAHAAAA